MQRKKMFKVISTLFLYIFFKKKNYLKTLSDFIRWNKVVVMQLLVFWPLECSIIVEIGYKIVKVT